MIDGQKERIIPIKDLVILEFQGTEFSFDHKVILKPLKPEHVKTLEDYRANTSLTIGRHKQGIEHASRVITSFRLYKEGRIGYHREFHAKSNGELTIGSLFKDEYGLPSRSSTKIWPNYRIQFKKLNEVKNVYGQLSRVYRREKSNSKQHEPLIQLALSRFNRSYDEQNAEDSLIDLMICLEMLFVDGKITGSKQSYVREKARKLALSSYLLNDKDKEVYYTLLKAYAMRNGIIHEGMRYTRVPICLEFENKKLKLTYKMFIRKVREYARSSLKTYIVMLDGDPSLTFKKLKQNYTFYQ